MSEGTPGPWMHDDGASDNVGNIAVDEGCKIVNKWGEMVAKAADMDDALLIAAAPELVEALEAVRTPGGGCWCYQGYFHPHQAQCLKAQAAIAKARGEST